MQGIIESFFHVLKTLDENEIPYMVVGSIATMVYGHPRMTHDLDIVVSLTPKDAEKIAKIFPPNAFYCPPPEVLHAEIVHRGQFNLIHQDSGLKIDFIVQKQSEHAIAEFNRRRKMPFWNGYEVYLASPEDVILKKLDYFRQGGSPKHLTDVRGILAETAIDESYLNGWIKKLSLENEWRKI